VAETVSACLIVLNEAERLPSALESVAFCDEIVVVDGGSTDRTVQLARDQRAKVIESPWPGYAAQRNVAIDNASGDWILEVDADERVSVPLREEIRAFLADPPSDIDIAAIPIRHRFLGRSLGPSAKYPGYRYRLFRRGAYRHDEARTVHEGLWSNDAVFAMHSDLEHVLADTWGEALADASRYARLEAGQVAVPLRPLAVGKALVARPAAKVAVRTVVFSGWRDGWRGLAKIGLDAASDVLIAARALRARDGRVDGCVPHAARAQRRGSIRVLGVAAAGDVSEAVAWLDRARALGADVCLLTDGATASHRVPVRRVSRFRAMPILRALDAENQLRPCDVVITIGRSARRLAWAIPRSLTGDVEPIRGLVEPAVALRHAARGRVE
jgi:hypothetical protein